MAQEPSDLLQFYERRVAAFDAERQDLLRRLDACSGATPADLYKMQAENRKRTEEVRELQKALSDAHTYLFEERERLLALQAENDGLRLQEVEDRARIRQLLSLTRPVEQKVVYGAENGPRANAVFPRSSEGSRSLRHGTGGPGRSRGADCGSGMAPGQPAPERILRTVYLPGGPQGEALALRCDALAAQLEEQKRFSAERVAALQQDRELRERDAAAHAAALTATAEDLAERLHGAEEALRCTTKDYILAKQQRDAAEAAAVAARADAAAAERQWREAVAEAQQAAEERLEQLRQELEEEARASIQAVQHQLAQREEELLKFETLHKLIRQQLEARATEAERRAARVAARNRELQQRRAYEMEGWAADVGQLRKRIAAVDRALRQQALLQRLPDDERRDAALARHARLASSTCDYEYECGVDELVDELLGIKDALLGMGERVRRQADLDLAATAGSDSATDQGGSEFAE